MQAIILDVGRQTEAASGAYTEDIYDRMIETIKTNGAVVVPIGDDARHVWAERLAAWPNERGGQIEDEAGVPMRAILKAYIKAAEDAGFVWPHRYAID